MGLIEDIRNKILRREYEFSKHAVDQTIVRDIAVEGIEEAVAKRSEIIEDYPDDKYGPSCLVLGFAKSGRPLHIHYSHPTRSLIKIITVYEPDSELWDEFRFRKEK
jgi:hypothetical protein